MISLKHIKKRLRSSTKIIKLKFSSKDLSSLINVPFAYARASICIQGWLKCDMSLVLEAAEYVLKYVNIDLLCISMYFLSVLSK